MRGDECLLSPVSPLYLQVLIGNFIAWAESTVRFRCVAPMADYEGGSNAFGFLLPFLLIWGQDVLSIRILKAVRADKVPIWCL